jgi:hypothetical protein
MDDQQTLISPIGQHALDLLRPQLLPPILHHSLRTFFLAAAEARRAGADVDPVDLLIGCLFHDSGTIPDDRAERFEVVGADRAVDFAREADRDPVSCRRIWDAVALHTSAGIAERHVPLTRALRVGVLADFKDPAHLARHQDLADRLDEAYPRAGIERVLAAAVVRAARDRPGKAPPASWPGDLVRGAASMADPEGDNPLF